MAWSSSSQVCALVERKICLNLAQAFSMGVQVGLIGWQIEQFCSCFFKQLAQSVDLV